MEGSTTSTLLSTGSDGLGMLSYMQDRVRAGCEIAFLHLGAPTGARQRWRQCGSSQVVLLIFWSEVIMKQRRFGVTVVHESPRGEGTGQRRAAVRSALCGTVAPYVQRRRMTCPSSGVVAEFAVDRARSRGSKSSSFSEHEFAFWDASRSRLRCRNGVLAIRQKKETSPVLVHRTS